MRLLISERGERTLVCKSKKVLCSRCKTKLDKYMYYCEFTKQVYCMNCSGKIYGKENEYIYWKVDQLRFENE